MAPSTHHTATTRSRPERWNPPDSWVKITTIDAHAAGEPLRIIVAGIPDIPGRRILDRRRHVKAHLDRVRTLLMREPRGHRDMYGCIMTPPVSREADFGVLFMHNEGYSTMCGHGIIALSTVVVQTGMVRQESPVTVVRYDTPAGLVTAHVAFSRGKVRGVRFRNVPSFVFALDQRIDVPGLGVVRYDIAFGGAFYAYVQASQLGLRCTTDQIPLMAEKGMTIKTAITNTRPPVHPVERDLGFLYGTIFVAPPSDKSAGVRNVCVFADGQVDRSPTGTGVSGLAALRYARKEMGLRQPLVVESVIGSRFTVEILETLKVGPYEAVVPEVGGAGSITGRHEFLLDPDDPLREGVIL